MSNFELIKTFKKYMRVKDKKTAHAKLSASGAERWVECPGSIQLSEKAPPQTDGVHGIRGTNTHTLLEFLFNERPHMLDAPEAKAFKEFIGYDEEMHRAAQVAYDFVREEKLRMFKETGVWPTLLIEQKVEVEGVGFGTSDIILYQPFGLLHVMDYKNGKSVVEPEDNWQGLYYANGAAEMMGWDFAKAAITIIQPNASHREGAVRTWHTSVDRIERAGDDLRIAAKKTRSKTFEFNVNSKWCYFCPAKTICPAQRNIQHDKIMSRFEKPAVSGSELKTIKESYYGKEKSSKKENREKENEARRSPTRIKKQKVF